MHDGMLLGTVVKGPPQLDIVVPEQRHEFGQLSAWYIQTKKQ